MIQVRRLVVHTVAGGEIAYYTAPGAELHVYVGAAAPQAAGQADDVRVVELPEDTSSWVLESQIVSYTE